MRDLTAVPVAIPSTASAALNSLSIDCRYRPSKISNMARFFAALLAAAAMLQVGSAAPFPYTNGTSLASAAPPASGSVNSTVSHEVLKRRLREYPIALVRP
ncbi:hypothetical protein F4814DRAFT_450188 [Daldinia grandis]|nr:hypothetical protein F4814DRAFT_450188 [Daldinia grandis]